ncbi:uncharacterized protein JN550_001192 [Neoarthrinium moseri]|uniref:uncharacterized protein n=1 Tax=Neoarthrinium moseri TaxID=1658444 RepID=UPI001FDB6B29|nr:uncharacterized protein JN550_001192 [Neoarthrinium moseri]KAI1877120.1 hypothetical protein JN550_001192 [Neoarthrinium moseri]
MASPVRRCVSVAVEDIQSIGSSDPIVASSPVEIPPTRQQPRGSLRRIKSLPHQWGVSEQSQPEVLSPQGHQVQLGSPVRANSKRRRSAVTTTGPQRSSSWSTRHGAITPNRSRSRSLVNESIEEQHGMIQAAWSSPDEPSRGRSRRRRTATPYPIVAETQVESHSSPQISQANSRRRRNARPGPAAAVLSDMQQFDELLLTMRSNSNQQSHHHRHIQKGVFLIREDPELDKFKFPVHRSQAEIMWRPGDGFSGDEAVPGFVFCVTGKHKRGPKYLPGMESLALGDHFGESGSIFASFKRRKVDIYSDFQRMKLRGAAKDVWPTYDDFVQSELPERPKRKHPPAGPKTVISDDRHPYASVDTALTAPPRTSTEPAQGCKRGPPDFRNLRSGVELRGPSNFTSAMLRMSAWRNSSPLQEPEDDASDDLGLSSDICSVGKTGYSEELSDEERSSSPRSVGTELSHWDRNGTYWDRYGNHLFSDDIRAANRARWAPSGGETEEDTDGGISVLEKEVASSSE